MNLNEFTLKYTDAFGLYITILILVLAFILQAKVKDFDPKIDRNTSNVLKGVFILTVVLHHFFQRLDFSSHIYDIVISKIYTNLGFLSVAIFFFLSGYALSIKNTNPPLFTFIKLKLFRVYIPCLFINIIISLQLQTFNINVFSPIYFDSTQWFIIAILIFYAFDYVANSTSNKIYSLIFLVLAWSAICHVNKLGDWWYISSFAFPLGYIWSNNQTLLIKFYSKHKLKTYSCLCIFFLMSYFLKNKYIEIATLSSMFFCLLVIGITCATRITSRPLEIIGSASLEIYVLHMKIAWITNYAMTIFNIKSSFVFLLYAIILISISIIFSKLNNKIIQLIKT